MIFFLLTSLGSVAILYEFIDRIHERVNSLHSHPHTTTLLDRLLVDASFNKRTEHSARFMCPYHGNVKDRYDHASLFFFSKLT